MVTLSKAPLIEAIFELRWGSNIRLPDGQEAIQLSENEQRFFFGQFKSAAAASGFKVFEKANPNIPEIVPHVVFYRFRKESGTWPCYQIGNGIFTANQINEGYNWLDYKSAIISGIELLREGYPDDIEKLPVLGLELRYQDGYLFNDGEPALDFLKNKFNITLSVADDFLQHHGIGDRIEGTAISFQLNTISPQGTLVFIANEAHINGAPGFVTQTIVRTMAPHTPALINGTLDAWLDEAHAIQDHAFEKALNPAFAKTLK